MKIALVGYGNMGQEIAGLISGSQLHEVVSVSYRNPSEKLDINGIKKSDVVIDFTTPQIILNTIETVSKLGKNMVIGTTGWYEYIPQVKKMVKNSGIGLIYGPNFSIGVNILFQLTEYASKLFNKVGGYDVYGFEIHHRGKMDSPSGTAKKISNIIIDNFDRKTELQDNKVNRKIEDHELHFASIRGGFNPGFHEVIFDSLADELRLTHYARGRKAFAQGAITAAEFIENKKGFYTIDDLFK